MKYLKDKKVLLEEGFDILFKAYNDKYLNLLKEDKNALNQIPDFFFKLQDIEIFLPEDLQILLDFADQENIDFKQYILPDPAFLTNEHNIDYIKSIVDLYENETKAITFNNLQDREPEIAQLFFDSLKQSQTENDCYFFKVFGFYLQNNNSIKALEILELPLFKEDIVSMLKQSFLHNREFTDIILNKFKLSCEDCYRLLSSILFLENFNKHTADFVININPNFNTFDFTQYLYKNLFFKSKGFCFYLEPYLWEKQNYSFLSLCKDFPEIFTSLKIISKNTQNKKLERLIKNLSRLLENQQVKA